MDHSNPENSTIDLIGQRGPGFIKKEVKVLVNLIEKYKTVILNKRTNNATNHAKDVVWAKITKQFNDQNIKHSRSTENLRTKWENLKRDARKVSKNVMDMNYTEFDEITNRVVSLLYEAENNVESIESAQASFQDLNDTEDAKENSVKYWEDDQSSDDSGSAVEVDRRARSLNFSPQECEFLLKCFKPEKEVLLSTETTKKMCRLKKLAWLRITEKFNRYSPNKRTLRVLKTKFENMKRGMNKVNIDKYLEECEVDELETQPFQPVKSEPLFESKMDASDVDEDNVDHSALRASPFQNNDNSIDPLTFVMNADSGIGSTNYMAPWNDFENKDVVKLKMELLNYQLETAKLKRKRLEEAITADIAEREAKALETSLRLRAARLEAAAAEMKLPPSHPALSYTEKETLAQEYIQEVPVGGAVSKKSLKEDTSQEIMCIDRVSGGAIAPIEPPLNI